MIAAWQCDDLVMRYPTGQRDALAGISLEIPPGRCTAVLGPNGSGKSTLLRALLGVLRPTSGEIRFRDRAVKNWPRDALAREIGVLPQGEESHFPMTVREMVAMGRYPHLGPWRREGARDHEAIARALRRCDVEGLADRDLATLSGGERQRARLARALAQEPGTLVLDEPTVALDVRHAMAILELLRGLREEGATILLVTHDLNLAARYADRLVVLQDGAVAAAGTPAEVLTRSLVERVWRWPVRVDPYPGPGPDVGAPQVTPLSGDACREMEGGGWAG